MIKIFLSKIADKKLKSLGFEKTVDPSGVLSVRVPTVRLEPFEGRDDVRLKDVATLEEAPRIGCGIMGLGGYYMGLNMSGSFSSSCWINGYGWIAVALVIFANWNPALAILGTFVFGFFSTLRVSGSSLAAAFPAALGWLAKVPTQLYQALPFLITAVVLVATSVRKREGSGCPAALGLNYFREER